nr:MAG TPA: hypothetical protein [Caudoviricetes sp.]
MASYISSPSLVMFNALSLVRLPVLSISITPSYKALATNKVILFKKSGRFIVLYIISPI